LGFRKLHKRGIVGRCEGLAWRALWSCEVAKGERPCELCGVGAGEFAEGRKIGLSIGCWVAMGEEICRVDPLEEGLVEAEGMDGCAFVAWIVECRGGDEPDIGILVELVKP
jgi:hypothetical protein